MLLDQAWRGAATNTRRVRGVTLVCDIAIIGLGPAGAAAAAAAAASSWRVIGIDRKQRAGEPVQCAEFVPALLANHTPLSGVIVQPIGAMHTYLESAPKHIQPQFPGHIISRAAFDFDLVERARAAGAEILLGARVTNVSASGDIELSDGRMLSARIVVAADGPRSIVGAAARRRNTSLVETRQITAQLHDPHSATDIFLRASLPGGYGWLFPKSGLANVGVGVDARYRDRLKPELARLHASLVEAGRVGETILATTGGVIPVGGMLDPIARLERRPILLAGDAAGLANPITGAGIAAAFISGKLAGAAAAAWVRGTAGALAGYREELSDLFKTSLDRALLRRTQLMSYHDKGALPPLSAHRAAWVAYPEYWSPENTTENTTVNTKEKAHDLLEA